jgi:hypothetical protein
VSNVTRCWQYFHLFFVIRGISFAEVFESNLKQQNQMKRMKRMLLGLLSFGALLAGCSKEPLANLTEEESRIYITDYDSKADFKTYGTFAISDSVAVIHNGSVSHQQNATDLAFINAVRSELTARGYVQVSRTANPDIAVNVTRIYNTSTGVIQYSNYWNDYAGYYDPYYYGYGGYGYYSPYSYEVYSVREGALSVDVLDLKNAAANNRINGIWTGLIRGSGIFNSGTAANQVGMLFNQSPYLSKTN